MRRYGFIIAFAVLLIAPLAAHALHGAWHPAPVVESGARLVIITPHEQDIRNEFRWAFADWHKRKYGQAIEVEYLTPGGTNDIRRELNLKYRAIREAHGGHLPPEDQIDLGIDLVWGGGDYYFNSQLKPLGILHPLDLDPKFLAEVFPQPTLAGVKLYDQDKDRFGNPLAPRWVGICLASFGIVYNPDLYRALNLRAPRTWSDLADPRLFRNLSLADPTHSGTAATTYMVIIQRAMADSENDFFNLPQNHGKTAAELKSTSPYQAALDAGWKKGMRQLLLIAANARYFSDSSPEIPNDVAGGDAAAGIAIDFYGRVTEQIVGPDRERFIVPTAATAITPDPIAILYGVHGKQLVLAEHFIEFLLSPEGQRLWILKPGQLGGPRNRSLRRSPIRQSVYADRAGWADDVDYFASARGFNQRAEWMRTLSELPSIWAAAWIDDSDDLQDVYARILSIPDENRRSQLLADLSDIPVTRPDVLKQVAQRKRIEGDPTQDPNIWKARQRLAWSRRFAEHYHQVAQETVGR
ncbi:MAG TPA: extracellular solute-binding protein [Tepidisphaeraceae bacterium]|nr:extracellular solute-binding protein [Tepidisphaeraceae bacterium]